MEVRFVDRGQCNHRYRCLHLGNLRNAVVSCKLKNMHFRPDIKDFKQFYLFGNDLPQSIILGNYPVSVSV